MKIAIIMCCFNRKDTTRRCLQQIENQCNQIDELLHQIYVYDDGSYDGTTEMIQTEFPQVKLILGNGKQYWCKSMHIAMKEASKENYDLYLMINDDVDFMNNALQVMLDNYYIAYKPCAIVGTTKALKSDECTYGGRTKEGVMIKPGEDYECYWANWNCFLIDKGIVNEVGIIDRKYQHAWGDYDYSIRMKKAGYPIYVANNFVGRCDRNSIKGTYKDCTLPKLERLKKAFSPKGVPLYSYMRYYIKNNGISKVPKYIYGYCSIIGYIWMGKSISDED